MPVLVIVIAVVAVAWFIASRVRTVAPNQALVVVGRGAGRKSEDMTEGQKVIVGGRTFVWPILQKAYPLSLEQRQVNLAIDAVDENFVPVSLRASVLFKVRGDESSVRRASQRFLSQQADLETPLSQAFEGALRPIIGSMTVKSLISDRQTLHEKVTEAVKDDLAEQGFQIDLIKISEITTPGTTYLQDLGRAEAAQAAQNAAVAEARARLIAETEQINTAEAIAVRERDLALKQADIQVETDAARAKAEAAGRLASADQDRQIAVEEQKALVEKARATDAQLDVDVRRPAEASKYAAVQQAEADRDAANAAAEADAFRRMKVAEANQKAAEADAQAKRAEGEALAAVRRAAGEAEAYAIEAEGLAKARAQEEQAKALSEHGQAVLMQQLIAALPGVVEAAAKPMGDIDNLTVVSTDGASALTRTVSQTVAEGSGLLGAVAPNLDLSGLLTKLLGGGVNGGTASDDAGASATSPANAPAKAGAPATTPNAAEQALANLK
ncbi:MAG: flotillin family protein [Cellulomonadaceae bacterium]|nr:flotillin family protein [Cellulomonadaceae bacterium]